MEQHHKEKKMKLIITLTTISVTVFYHLANKQITIKSITSSFINKTKIDLHIILQFNIYIFFS
jgi:hypothetical protein